MFCFTTKKPLTVFYGVEMMLLGRLKYRRRWRRRKPQKCNGLRLAKQQLCNFFVGTAPLRREIAEFDPHIDNVKTRRRLSLLFSLLNLNIIITNSTTGGFVFIWLRPRPHLFFFSVFGKKYAYSRSLLESFSLILTFSKPAPFPVSAGWTLKRWECDTMIASLTQHTLYDEWDHGIYDLRFRSFMQKR